MPAEGIDEDDILQSARISQGLETLDQMKYVVLERKRFPLDHPARVTAR